MVNVYGPDSPESKAMNQSPGIDEAVAHYRKTGERTKTYEFSPHWKDGKLTNTEGVIDRHRQADNPITFTTGGYTTYITPLANGSLSILVMNIMSANSFLGHVGDYLGINLNQSRNFLQPSPLSNTYQYYLIIRP